MPDAACGGPSDVAPIWNPEFFGNTIVVNGATWPSLDVEQRRYRLRFLNGCDARFLILRLSNGQSFWQIGNEGGFLPAPLERPELLLAPAERADVIVDFTHLPRDTEIILQNIAPDEPFGGGVPGVDFEPADPQTTGQVMRFHVVAATRIDASTPPGRLVLPAIAPLGPATDSRAVSLNEAESATVPVSTDHNDNTVLDCVNGEPFAPVEADLGTLNPDGTGKPLGWDEPITETPTVGAIELWDIHNFTADAHPIHIHEITFEVISRRGMPDGARGPARAGGGAQGHGHRVPQRDHPGQGALRPPRAVRVALPHPRTRGQRDDAPISGRTLTKRDSTPVRARRWVVNFYSCRPYPAGSAWTITGPRLGLASAKRTRSRRMPRHPARIGRVSSSWTAQDTCPG
jgi:FtsP/CotA-like multicopper oxidase with cupredoxin domain